MEKNDWLNLSFPEQENTRKKSEENSDPQKNSDPIAAEALIRVAAGTIKVTEKPITIYRCQAEVCEPEQAMDPLFTVQLNADDHETLIVKNIGYKTVTVRRELNPLPQKLEIPDHSSVRIQGTFDLSFEQDRPEDTNSLIIAGSGNLLMNYEINQTFTLYVFDKVFDKDDTILEYLFNLSDENVWDDSAGW